MRAAGSNVSHYQTYAWRNQHRIEWNDAGVIDQASRHKELPVKKVLHIQTSVGKNSLNRDGGVEVG